MHFTVPGVQNQKWALRWGREKEKTLEKKNNLKTKKVTTSTEPWKPKKHKIWGLSKNYLNHSQHTRLVHRQRHRQASVCNTGPAQASAAPSRLAWLLKVAPHQLNSTKIHCNRTSSSSCKNQNQQISLRGRHSVNDDWIDHDEAVTIKTKRAS